MCLVCRCGCFMVWVSWFVCHDDLGTSKFEQNRPKHIIGWVFLDIVSVLLATT